MSQHSNLGTYKALRAILLFEMRGANMAKKIILDCDPGHDDAVAILLALGNPEIEIVGITTVGGNQSLEKVTYNARAMLEAAHAHDILSLIHILPIRSVFTDIRQCVTLGWSSRTSSVSIPSFSSMTMK